MFCTLAVVVSTGSLGLPLRAKAHRVGPAVTVMKHTRDSSFPLALGANRQCNTSTVVVGATGGLNPFGGSANGVTSAHAIRCLGWRIYLPLGAGAWRLLAANAVLGLTGGAELPLGGITPSQVCASAVRCV
jgi:hypothetical protein